MPFDDFSKKDESKFKYPPIKNTFNNGKRSPCTLNNFFPVRKSIRKTKKAVLEERRNSLEKAVLSKKEDGLKVLNIYVYETFFIVNN